MTRKMCALLLLLSAACDAQNATGATAAATAATAGNAGNASAADAAGAKDDKPSSKPDDPATAAGGSGPVKFNNLGECIQTCEGGDMIPTNRETCRLNCDAAYGAQPAGTAGSADPVGKAAACFGRCYAGDAATDDCGNSCKTMASSATSPPASDVLDRLGTCIRTCHADKSVIPTNRATCELNCAQAARVVGPAQPATK